MAHITHWIKSSLLCTHHPRLTIQVPWRALRCHRRLGRTTDHLSVLVHEIWSARVQILNQLVAHSIVLLEPCKILHFDESIPVHIDLFHHKEGYVPRHLRQSQREARLIDIAHVEDLSNLGHDADLEVAQNDATLLISVNLREQLRWIHHTCLAKWVLLLCRRWKHFTQTGFHFVLVHEAVPLRIHQIEQCVEGLFEQAGPLSRELPILLDLWEVFLEEIGKLVGVEVAV